MNTNKDLNYRLFIQREQEFVRTDIKSEFEKYNTIKYGDVEKVAENFKKIRKNFYAGKGTLSDNPLRNNIYHLVVAAGIIARICVDGGMEHDVAYTLSDIYIRKADVAKTPDEVIDLIEEMQLDFAARMKEIRKLDAVSLHVRRAVDYIYEHLHEALTLEKLAGNANLNPSYFSKLFAKETGSTVKAYIINAKVSTAQNMLRYSDFSLSDIAFSLGFSSQSAFTYVFRKTTGVTPGSYRNIHSFRSFDLD
jgi:AraC-like DNA-binding protein